MLPSFNPPLVLDGALATELEARGADITNSLWSASALVHNPSLIRDVHRDYFIAGASVAITASYQASHHGFASSLGLTGTESDEIIRKSVQLAQEARNDVLRLDPSRKDKLIVAGSVGPYGAYLSDGSEYRGDYDISATDLADFHRPRIRALVAAGVDVLACETMPSFEEIRVLCSLIEEEVFVPCWVSVTLRDALHISDGTTLARTSALLDSCSSVVAVGVNCVSKSLVTPALKEIRHYTSKPLVAYPNSGERWDAKTKRWYESEEHGEEWDDLVTQWYKAGARMIGGCCRTGPEDIKHIAAALASSQE